MFFDSFCHCGSQQHGIHYPSGISTLAEIEHVIKNSSTFITFLFAGTRHYAAHYHTFTFSHLSSTNPSAFTFSAGKRVDMRFHPESQAGRVISSSSVLLRSVSPDAQERKPDFNLCQAFCGEIQRSSIGHLLNTSSSNSLS